MPAPYFANSFEDLLDRDILLSMSGLDFLRGMLAGNFASPPMAQAMNFRLSQIDQGKAVFHGAPQFDHCNPMGGIHGGWYGTILDSALGCAVMTAVPKGSVYTTLEYKINITRALKLGTEVMCAAALDHSGRSTGVASAEIRGVKDNRLYATGSTTCIIMEMR